MVKKSFEHFLDLQVLDNLNHQQQKDYLQKCVFPMRDARHVVLFEDSFQVYNQSELNSLVLNKLDEVVGRWYRKEYKKIFKFESNPDAKAPFVDYEKQTVNFMSPMKATYTIPYDEYSDEAKEGVEELLNYINKILLGDSVNEEEKEELYNFVLRWLKLACTGGKNETILYLQGEQGAGKSTLFNFLLKHVFGDERALTAKSSVLTSKYNAIIQCMSLINFEELNYGTEQQRKEIEDNLKTWLTSSYITYEDKYIKAFQDRLFGNFYCSTNFSPLDPKGRRVCILPLTNKYIADKHNNYKKLYWDPFYKKVFKDEVGCCFLAYLIDKVDFVYEVNGKLIEYKGITSDIPESSIKNEAVASRIGRVAKFLKNEYLKQNKAIAVTKKGLYLTFSDYCIRNGMKKMSSTDFYNEMKKLNFSDWRGRAKVIEDYEIEGSFIIDPSGKNMDTYFYKIPLEELKKRGESWMTEFDKLDMGEKVTDENVKDNTTELFEEFEQTKKDKLKYKKLYKKLEKENEELNEKVRQLEELLKRKPKKEKEVIKTENAQYECYYRDDYLDYYHPVDHIDFPDYNFDDETEPEEDIDDLDDPFLKIDIPEPKYDFEKDEEDEDEEDEKPEDISVMKDSRDELADALNNALFGDVSLH